MDSITLVNGRPSVMVDALDRGLAYGDGLFETIALVQGQVQLWQAHKQRLIAGLISLGIVLDKAYAEVLLDTIAVELKAAYVLFDRPEGVIKITVTRGSGGRGYAAPASPILTRIISIMPWPKGRELLSSKGVSVGLCQHRWSHNTALAGIKHLNRLDQVLARSEWFDESTHEGIMLNQDGGVVSGAMSNIFIEVDGMLITPKLDQCGIKGTMAQHISAMAQNFGINVLQQPVSLHELMKADAVLMTNSINGIWPVVALSADVCTQWPISKLTITLQKALAKDLSHQTQVSNVC